MDAFTEVFRFAIAFILLIAVVAKARRPKVFVRAVGKLDLVPRTVVRPAAYTLILLEALVGAWLLAGQMIRPGLAAAAILFSGFAVTGVMALRRDEGDCGCLGGALALRFNHLMVLANVAVAVIAAAVATWGADHETLPVRETLVIASAGLLAAVCYWVLSYAESVRKMGEETARLIQAR